MNPLKTICKIHDAPIINRRKTGRNGEIIPVYGLQVKKFYFPGISGGRASSRSLTAVAVTA